MRNWFALNRSFPPFIEHYASLNFSPKKNTPIEELTFTVFDCETTGLDKKDRLVSVGAVRVKAFSISVEKPLDLIWEFDEEGKASAIHEIISSAELGSLENKAQAILSFFGNSVLVGHHVAFDVQKVNQAIADVYPGFRLKNPTVDTFSLMQRLFPDRMQNRVAGHDAFNLDALCEEFHIEIENRHTALGDAYLTAQLLMKLLYRLQKRGVHRSGDLLRKANWRL